jgi:putative spermidine/putrescine transport system substrate-binding protein
MKKVITRRRFVTTVAKGGVVVAGSTMAAPFVRTAWAKEPLTVVEWGTPYVESSQAISAKQDIADITWALHEGGSAAILPKIKSSWPNPPYDLIAAWKPVWLTMIREGWIEPVTLEKVPNMKDIPKKLITTDENGVWYDVPRSLSGVFWAYRTDTCPIEITNIEDLLDPSLVGQISWPHPIANTNLQVASLAMGRGGDEHNMEPGWKFLKELAKSGNIGRVHATTADQINALTAGEVSIIFTDLPSVGVAAKNVPIKYLTKTHETLKMFPWVESWGVLKSSKNKMAAFDYANFSITPENNKAFNEGIGAGATNVHVEASGALMSVSYTEEELAKFAHFADYDRLSKDLDASTKRFETEIVPLL